MDKRPELNTKLDGATFLEYYYLKEELVDFCRSNKLPTSGNKTQLTNVIAHYLDAGKALPLPTKQTIKRAFSKIAVDTKIEPNFVCTERHRTFFKEKIGKTFTFNVAFQKWLKDNAGKTYAEAIEAYHSVLEERQSKKSVIDKQFEYNTYIRDFFADNTGYQLSDAILCWKYKKGKKGHNRYEKADLSVLDNRK